MKVNLVLVKDGYVVDFFGNIGHYYMLDENTIRLKDGTEIGGLKVDFYVTENDYEVGDSYEINEDLNDQYLELTMEQKLDLLNAD
jgi:hypothetical protein